MMTAATNKRIRELIEMVKEEKLIPRPEFQRRLIWTREDKNHFLDSILRGFPFPEIYLAEGDTDLETGVGTLLLVDGLQRVSTMIQYFEGNPELKLTSVPAYKDLTSDEKSNYLQYQVAVRDLGKVSKQEIIDVFRRINATKYSLLDIEINNAIYSGELKKFADRIAAHPFFETHKTFSATDYKRMGDLRYALQIIITMLGGYFNRDDSFEEFLSRYNDEFPDADQIAGRLDSIFEFIEECGFPPQLRIWRKADLFSLIVELDGLLSEEDLDLQPSILVNNVQSFFSRINAEDLSSENVSAIYYKAALQASNDRANRMRRGVILEGIMRGTSEEAIRGELILLSLVEAKARDLPSR